MEINTRFCVIFEGFFGYKIANFGDRVMKITEIVQMGGTSRMNLVSLKNIDIWLSYRPKSL